MIIKFLLLFIAIIGWVFAVSDWQEIERIGIRNWELSQEISELKADQTQFEALIAAQNEKIKDLKWRNNVWMMFYGTANWNQLLKTMEEAVLETTSDEILMPE